jgi:hypothetical protein
MSDAVIAAETYRLKKQSRIKMIESVFQQLQRVEEYIQKPFDWKTDDNGWHCSAERLCNAYFSQIEYARSRFMETPTGWLDRHKIIAFTQDNLLRILPLAFRSPASEEESFKLNVDFAFLFGIHFLCKMNERYYPAERFDNANNAFKTAIFLHPFLKTKEGQEFVREHKTYLNAERNGSTFPQFLIAQLWTAMEQWGLAYARSQKEWPRER